MEKEGIIKHRLLPIDGLHKGTQYHGSPVGDSPELNSCHSYFDEDLDNSVRRYCAVTSHLPNDHYKYIDINTLTWRRRYYFTQFHKELCPASIHIFEESGRDHQKEYCTFVRGSSFSAPVPAFLRYSGPAGVLFGFAARPGGWLLRVARGLEWGRNVAKAVVFSPRTGGERASPKPARFELAIL